MLRRGREPSHHRSAPRSWVPSCATHHLGDIAVLSRWPISSPRSVWTVPGWSDVMRVEVVRPGAPFVVYAMHLGNPLFKTTYTQHAEMVERLVAAAQAESLPVVLAGDFNMSDRSASYRELGGAFRDAIRTSFADTTYDDGLWMLLQLRIDYIFVSRSLCARSATTFTVPGSDHDGLEVEIGTRSS